MKRRLEPLAAGEFDLVVIGGGIFGACAAWDATQRGLSVALIERSDFGAATSANSFKMIHGGIRYIQHGDLPRLRTSSNERRAFLRIAPHLVRPLRILVPTFGHGMRGRMALRAGVGLYDLLTRDRNRGLRDPSRQVEPSRMVSREEVLRLFPALRSEGLTGGAMICEGQMHNPPRLVLSFVRSAVESGAVAANYLEAVEYLLEGGRVRGVRARDLIAGDELTLRARVVLNAAGPYAGLLDSAGPSGRRPGVPLSRDACFVVRRRLTPSGIGLAVQGATRDPDARFSRGERHLFLVPWRGHTLVGVWHKVYGGHPDRFSVAPQELDDFIAEINASCPWLAVGREDVSIVNAGLVPFGENPSDATHLRYGHRSKLVDHADSDGREGLITLIGVRFTTGRHEASRAVDLVFRKLGYRGPRCRTAETPVWGGDITDLEAMTRDISRSLFERGDQEVARALALNYGSSYEELADCFREAPELAKTIGESTTLRAEVVHAVREEMAQTLSDVIFRRTDLATAGLPGGAELSIAAGLMAAEKGWGRARLEQELEEASRSPILARALA